MTSKLKHLLLGYLRKFGVGRTTVFITVGTVFLSMLLSAGIESIIRRDVDVVGLTIAFFVPLVLCPPICYLLCHLTKELDQAKSQLDQLIIRDDLTNVYNRKYYYQMLEQAYFDLQRYAVVFSLLTLDLDDFKLINDQFGHPAGDEVLKQFSTICTAHCRETDQFFRIGGDEFVFILSHTNMAGARRFAKRILQSIEAMKIRFHENTIKITASIGIKAMEESESSLQKAMNDADVALYKAKKLGKNKMAATTS